MKDFSSRHLPVIIFFQLLGYTALLLGLFFWGVHYGEKSVIELASSTARASAVKDLLYREMFVAGGGVYLEVSDSVLPDPSQQHRPDRDMTTSAGKHLTFVTPNRVIKLAYKSSGTFKAAIKFLQPLCEEDTPDEWDKKALTMLLEGKDKDYGEVVELNGEKIYRFMYPLPATAGCVSNRPGQNLKVGDMLGGISIQMPLKPYEDLRERHNKSLLVMYGILWGLGAFGIAGSYTVLRRRNDALLKAEAKTSAAYSELNQIFEASPVGMVKISSEGDILKANEAFGKIAGIDSHEAIGRKIHDVLPVQDGDCCSQGLAALSDGSSKARCEIELSREEGKAWFVCSAVSLSANQQNSRDIIINFYDVTDRKQAEASIREANEELEKTFDAIGDIITIHDEEMRIIRVNRTACDKFNAKSEDLIGRYCYEVFRGAESPCQGCPELLSRQDGKLHQSEIKHDNLNKVFEVATAPIMGAGEKITKVVHYAKDITEKTKLEMQLRQAQKMEAIGTLAGGIAHDFNNILTAIMGYSELANLDLQAQVDPSEDLAEVMKAANRARDLVKQILAFSRQSEQELQPVNIRLLIKEALKLLRASIPASIDIQGDLDENCGLVIADPSQVHQIIMNLCTNAYHAMRQKGGTLNVSLVPVNLSEIDVEDKEGLLAGSYLLLTVSDNGIGMDQATRDRIFEPYFTTKGKGEGTGLGLSVVHGIVQAIGGFVSVYSELDKGTAFQLYLPVIHDESGGDRDVSAGQIPMGKERILIIDDEKTVVGFEEKALQSLGYQVESFTDCILARETFEKRSTDFDLIITDMSMPHISGTDLALMLKAVRSDIPIIMCTGFSEMVKAETAHEFGIARLLMKPVSLSEMAQAVRTVLDEKM